jgi:TP901-1 family phage major tail protein
MSAQKGKDLLLKVETAVPGTYVTVAGLRSRSISINAESVDSTHSESAGRWRELLEGAGVKSARVSGSGIFKDTASDAAVRQYCFDGAIKVWQLIIPDFGSMTGLFQITSIEFSGRHDGEVAFDLTLESAGELTFIAI